MEREVALKLITGMRVNEIAQSLNKKQSTIATYKQRIRGKFGDLSDIELVDKLRVAVGSTAWEDAHASLLAITKVDKKILERLNEDNRDSIRRMVLEEYMHVSQDPDLIQHLACVLKYISAYGTRTTTETVRPLFMKVIYSAEELLASQCPPL